MDQHIEIKRTPLPKPKKEPILIPNPPLPEENTFIEPYVPRKRPRLTEDQLKSHSVTVNYDRIANADLGLFRRVHRHLDNVTETLSPISTRSNNSFSRFDRIFDMDTFKSKSHSVVSSLRDHSLRDDISEVTKSETSKSEASMLNRLKTMQERITVFERPQSSFTQRLEEHQTTKPPPSSIERPLEPLLEEPVAYEQQQDTHTSMDNNLSPSKPSSPALSAKGKEKEDVLQAFANIEFNDYGGGDNDLVDDDQKEEEVSSLDLSTELESMLPFNRVNAGNCLSRKLVQAPYDARFFHDTYGPSMLTNKEIGKLFKNRLDPSKKIRSTCERRIFTKIVDLFFEQVRQDLSAYKQNQPAYLQDTIQENDVILLMKR
ncbi:uncharacterized protein B0P05DRAFT_564071 [Gilbertella persicaria]|uniref:uncharacterized protein n=1 Tax=Gilbertella persicaria TaxID=101096 RepID=UPI002220E984|nr:uncharacterized protein B0P05DRAFT_564071 [Gilbertella persicaria]KAI8048937.1 hypothetical protein B0P05DRAFT_564071 [Gilbertella persicaria]